MHKILLQLVEKTVDAAHLSEEESVDLREELISHIEAHSFELQLAGFSEEKIIEEIIHIFGPSDEIAKQLYIAYRRFEHLPVIGQFLYYMPLTLAGKMFLLNVIQFTAFILVAIIFFGLSSMYEITGILSKAEMIILTALFGFGPAIFFLYTGWWLSKKRLSLLQNFEALIFALLPIVLPLLYKLIREVVSLKNLRTDSDIIFYLLLCIVIGNCIGVCTGVLYHQIKNRNRIVL